MDLILTIHALIGERVLPLIIVVVAIWLTVTWRPDAPANRLARLFPILVDIQVTLGLVYFIYGLAIGGGSRYLAFPFILHPILGIAAAVVAHRAVRPGGLARGLGRWSPLVALVVLLLIVIVNIILANTAA